MTAKGITEDVQEKVIHSIGSFALYGFPESHAISFGLIAYASCWLKVHHPAEFYTGLINNQPMGFYNVNTLLQDAKRHGIRTRPVCVVASSYLTTIVPREEKRKTKNGETKNEASKQNPPSNSQKPKTHPAERDKNQSSLTQYSYPKNSDSALLRDLSVSAVNNKTPSTQPRPSSPSSSLVQKHPTQSNSANLSVLRDSALKNELPENLPQDSLRLGLHSLKGLSQGTADRILTERQNHPFTSLADFLQRARPNKKERRLLAENGALNNLPDVQHRRHALWQVERPLQLELFTHTENVQRSTSNAEHRTEEEPSVLPPMSPWQRLASDFATQNQTTGPHPLKLWRSQLQNSNFNVGRSTLDVPNLKTANQLHNLPHGSYLQIAGMVICRQRPQTAKGHCFISLEDETGIANIFVPKKTFEHHRLTITTEPFLLIEGSLQIGEGNSASVYTHNLWPLNHLPNSLKVTSHDFH